VRGVRLSDLAEELGLDISTVSRALRGDPRVKPETRERVASRAESLGYMPNLRARALAEGRSRTVWLVLPGFEDPVERLPASFAGRWFFERDYDLLLAPHHDDPRIYARILGRLASGGADGAILMPGPSARRGDGILAERPLIESGFPFAYLDRSVPGVAAPVVTTDNAAAGAALAAAAFEAAAARGSPLALAIDAFDPGRNPVEAARSEGWRAGMAERRVPVLASAGASGDSAGAALASAGPGAAIAIAASAEATIVGARLALPSALSSKPAFAAAFDEWDGKDSAFKGAFIAIQDFEAMANAVASLLAEGLASGAPLPEARILVPILGVRSA
jgi:DNA-binding LacI/PurR family transcriptional regulator